MTIWTPSLPRTSVPIYLAVANAIEAAIAGGELAPGGRLPPQRDLADELRVTTGTITRAYAEASRRGLVRGEVGRGTFVLSGREERQDFRQERHTEPALVNLGLNHPPVSDAERREAPLAAALQRLATQPNVEELLAYQSPAGIERHRSAGAAWMQGLGLEADPERTLVCAGTQHALAVALSTLARPGDVVLTEALTYPGLRALAATLHLRLVGVEMDEEGMLPEALDAACRLRHPAAVYIVPSQQNPTTAVMSPQRRRDIAEVARKHHLPIVDDDVHAALLDEPIAPLASYCPELAFHVASLSKCVAPGLRTAFLHVPPQRQAAAIAAQQALLLMAPPLLGEIACGWIEDGTARRIAGWKREEARARQAAAACHLAGQDVATQPTSFHLWLRLPEPWRASEFVDEARRRGVAVTSSEAFLVDRREAPHAVRLCLGGAQDACEAERGVCLVADILESQGTRGPCCV